MKKNFKLPLNWLLCTFLLGGWANASTVHAQWLSNAQYLKAFTAKKKFLAISEEKGIALLDGQGKVLSDIPTRSEQMDFRWLPNSTEQGVLTTLDINTGNIQLIKVDFSLNKIELVKAYVPKNTAIDALCLGVSSSNIELFTVNVAGEVTQMILNTSAQEDWQ